MTTERGGVSATVGQIREAIDRCGLDLTGAVVLTEAATGPYVVAPVLAALAGASEVIALTRASRFGTVSDVERLTTELAEVAGVAGRIRVTGKRVPEDFARADIVTNSGHVRPIDATVATWLRPDAVVPLMYEGWEFQDRSDLDLEALRRRGIAVAGTNERHPNIDVFSFLGAMAGAQLEDAGLDALGATIGVLCDNPFRDYLVAGLERLGARVWDASSVAGLIPACLVEAHGLAAIMVALQPGTGPVLAAGDVKKIASSWPGALVAQFWGDLDRDALAAAGLRCWPPAAPPPGHMGVLPSRLGVEPVLRLQTGGLKVAQVLRIPPYQRTVSDSEYVDEL